MKQHKVVSVNTFARRFGLTRSAVIERVRRGELLSQYDPRTKLYTIPMVEVERTRNEILAEGNLLGKQRTNASSLAYWLDTLVAKAAETVRDAEADLKRQTAGTKAQRVAQETLDKAIIAHSLERELLKTYLVIAKRIEKAGYEFIERFNAKTGEANAK